MSRVTVEHALNAGLTHHQAGRLQEAESVYRQILSQHPEQQHALHLLGVIAHQCGRNDMAIELIRKAVAIQPNFSAAWSNLGESYRVSGRIDEAIVAYRNAIEQDPDGGAEAVANLGLALFEQDQVDEAIVHYRKAIALNPRLAHAYNNLGNALLRKDQNAEALAAFETALSIVPNFAECHNNQGSAFEAEDRLQDAMNSYRRAAELKPDFSIAYNNYGNVCRRLGRWQEAMQWCRRSYEINPNFSMGRWNVGLIELTHGDYINGLPKYELRFQATPQRPPLGIDRPNWDGRDLAGRTILIHAEQGFGDGFQAARYLPMVVARGGRIVVECHPAQLPIFRQLESVAQVVAQDEARPPYDVFASMMSLPLLFGTTLTTIPEEVPYLKGDPDRVSEWRSRLASHGGKKVGLVWAGSSTPDPLRSMGLDDLAPLAEVAGVRFVSLQVGPAAEAAKNPPGGLNLLDLGADLTDFGETAAVMENLDLILSIDTAACHLAGALGRPTWTMLPFSPDWRWLLDREDSPWYPTMRLFRQSSRKQWGDVIERVVAALKQFAAGGDNPPVD